jgi:hypothetical protein
MKKQKRHIALFCIALMLLFKVAGLHAITHQADDSDAQHCEVCVVTVSVGFEPFLETEAALLPILDRFYFELESSIRSKSVVFHNKHLTSFHLTRPPPQSL